MQRVAKFSLLCATIVCTLLVTSCAPTLKAIPPAAAIAPPVDMRTDLRGGVPLEGNWWTSFGDPQLVRLVEQARLNNTDVAVATARIDEARSIEATSRSVLSPTLEGGISGGAQRVVSAFGRGQNSLAAQPLFRASYELELFGRGGAIIEGAEAGVSANLAAKEAVLLTVSAATATGYVSLLALDARRDMLIQTLEVRRQSVTFARRRAQSGYTSQLEWRQAQAEYQATAQLLPQLDTQIARQENALSVLTGELPNDIKRRTKLARLIMPASPQIVPSELLRRRPDVAVAEYQLAASDAGMRVARTRFMPTIGISATSGVAISDLLANPISIWSLGGSLLAPIFNGGRLQSQFDAATARRDQAAFAYRGIVLNAFREVEDRLAVLAQLDAQKAALDAQRVAVADALRHATNRYRAGYSPHLEQLDAQRGLQSVELALIQFKADQILAMIGLYQATGGGTDPLRVGQ
jgi:outer membrane protein, multidrug efflux system